MKKALVALFLITLTGFSSFAEDSKPPKIPKPVIFSHYRLCGVKIQALFEGAVWITMYKPCGTATAIGKRQLICCDHEVHMYDKMVIEVFDKNGVFERRIPVCLDKACESKDIAVLSSEEDVPYWVDIRKENDASVGDWVYAVGARAGGIPFGITPGFLLSKSAEDAENSLSATNSLCGGNSGGGLYDFETHTFLGMIYAYNVGKNEGQSHCYIVPAKTIVDFIDEKTEDD